LPFAIQDPEEVRAELRRALLRTPREIAPKWFYDDVGSELFERICSLPEYYPTRTERALLATHADAIVARTGAAELVELGPGAATKTRLLLDAMARAGTLRHFVALDCSDGMVRRVAGELVREYESLHVTGIIGDFMEQLRDLPPEDAGPRLVAFLGGTIGNFRPPEARDFLARVAARMRPGDHFLLGTDLVKPVARLEAAYNDSAGVTAAFNKNILRVLNRLVDGDFDPESFRHRAFYDHAQHWIEMRLVSERAQTIHLPGLELTLHLRAGEEIRTEISVKYDHSRVRQLLGGSGFRLLDWMTDPEDLFALSLAQRV
jgi:L-histidine N-alpha-methyltransferase